jgi:hypothetical protein
MRRGYKKDTYCHRSQCPSHLDSKCRRCRWAVLRKLLMAKATALALSIPVDFHLPQEKRNFEELQFGLLWSLAIPYLFCKNR